jgi:chaperone required for assembly of F1-ATPase
MKRFYTDVTVDAAGHILLDGRFVRTPARAELAITFPVLAQAIADEWAGQGDQIDPRSMPLTGLANAAIDHMSRNPQPHIASLSAYGANDLLCYRADADQADLLAEQARLWNPILNWAERHYAIEFAITQGIIPVDQPFETIATLNGAVAAMSPWQLAALSPLVTISGSLIAGLAVIHTAFNANALWDATCLDALWQEAQWGTDADAVAQRAAHKADWDAAVRFIALIDLSVQPS